MNFWCLQISQKANQISDRFLPYEEAREEICQKFMYVAFWAMEFQEKDVFEIY